MDTQISQTPLRSGKMKLVLGVVAGIVVTLIVAMSGNLSSLTGSVGRKEQKVVDMTVTWTVPASVLSSENIVQTLDIGNAGPTTVKRFKIVQMIPAGAAFTSIQTSDPVARANCNQRQQVKLECTVTPAGSGMQQDGHLAVMIAFRTHSPKKPIPCGQIFRSGEVRVSAEDNHVIESTPENNTAPAVDTTVDCSDITTDVSVQTMATPSPIVPSETMQYTVTAVNNGPGKTKGVKIRQKYPEGMTFAGGSVMNCIDSPKGREVVCNPSDDADGMEGILQPGQSAQLELRFAIDPSVPGCTYVQGSTSVSVPANGTDALIDPVPENNQADLTTEVACQ